MTCAKDCKNWRTYVKPNLGRFFETQYTVHCKWHSTTTLTNIVCRFLTWWFLCLCKLWAAKATSNYLTTSSYGQRRLRPIIWRRQAMGSEGYVQLSELSDDVKLWAAKATSNYLTTSSYGQRRLRPIIHPIIWRLSNCPAPTSAFFTSHKCCWISMNSSAGNQYHQ